ncbi:MAG TPA: autotransporter domain-containing protein [Herbaspirillum sp.]|jgi:outer membrane autotransporter protein
MTKNYPPRPLVQSRPASGPGQLTILALSLAVALAAPHAGAVTVAPSQTTTYAWDVSSDPDLIVNAGTTISSTATTALTGALVTTGNSGTLTNDGVLSANRFGFFNGGFSVSVVDNRGTMTGFYGLVNNGGTITDLNNSGTITNTESANQGVLNSGGLITRVTNSGVMTGLANSGSRSKMELVTNTATGTIGTLTNTGVITGISNAGTIGSVTNASVIGGSQTQAAISITGTGSIGSLVNQGTIAGTISNTTNNALIIKGAPVSSVFSVLTGYSRGLGVSDIGSILSNTDVTFSGGNQLLNDNVNVGANAMTNAAVLQVNNSLSVTGNYQQNAGATLLIGVSSPTSRGNLTDTGYGRLVVNGNAVIASGSAIILQSLGYAFANGQRYVVMSANGSGTNYNADSLVYAATGFAVSSAVQIDSSNTTYSDLVLTLSGGVSNTPANQASTGNAASPLGGLFNYAGTDSGLLAVFNPAAALDTAGANKADAQLNPAAINSATTQAVDEVGQMVDNIASARMDSIRLAQNGASGVATGESSADIGLWGQYFGGRASQGMRDGISGYHANYQGLVLGADGLVADAVRAGGLFSASKTSVASDGDNTGSSGNVNNYGLTAYATYSGSPWYVNMLAGVARQQYSTVRNIGFTGFAGTANGSFNGMQYLTSLQAGYPLNLDAWLPGATLTPIAGLSYSTLRQNGYTETGGNGAALQVNAATSNSLKSELGAKLEGSFDISYGKLLPSVQLSWLHEYKNGAVQTGASFAADSTGSTAFVSQRATPAADVGVLNIGVTLVRKNNLSLTAKYALESGGGFLAQTGSVQARWQF